MSVVRFRPGPPRIHKPPSGGFLFDRGLEMSFKTTLLIPKSSRGLWDSLKEFVVSVLENLLKTKTASFEIHKFQSPQILYAANHYPIEGGMPQFA